MRCLVTENSFLPPSFFLNQFNTSSREKDIHTCFVRQRSYDDDDDDDELSSIFCIFQC